ncbi:MAG TPA: TolC family protein [Rhizomicrobium sp.]|jgi:outer membrane protein TolC
MAYRRVAKAVAIENGGLAYPALAAAVDTLPGTGLAANAAASLVQVIFDGGKLRAKTDETKAREDELLAAYRGAVIAAFADVENALGGLRHLSTQEEALKDQVTQDEKVLRAAQRKYLANERSTQPATNIPTFAAPA